MERDAHIREETAEGAQTSLLERMRSGDRDAAAALVQAHAPVIRARIRRQLSSRIRRVFDSQDIVATLFRRVDVMVQNGTVQADSDARLIALLSKIAQHAIVDKARIVDRFHKCDSEDRPFVKRWIDDGDRVDIEESMARVFDRLEEPEDRSILTLWLHGLSHSRIGDAIGVEEGRVRWRWHAIRQELREQELEYAAAP